MAASTARIRARAEVLLDDIRRQLVRAPAMPADVRPDARVHPGVLLRADGAEAPRARQLLQLGGRDGLQPVLYGLRRPGGVRGQPERPRGLAPAGAVR